MFATLEAKLIAVVVVLTVLIAGSLYLHHKVYAEGVAAGAAQEQATEQKREVAQKKADDAKLASDTKSINNAINPIAVQIDHSLDIQPVTVKTVTRIVHDNPTFAACARPVELNGVRQSQLEAIRAAAAASPFPAPSSSAGM